MEDTSKSFFLASKADLQNELSKTKHSFLSAEVFRDIHKMPKYEWLLGRTEQKSNKWEWLIWLQDQFIETCFNNLNTMWYFLIKKSQEIR